MARGAGAYICTNVNRPRCTTMAVAALIRITSVDPFPALPDAVKRVALRLPRPGAAGRGRRTANQTQ
jgi:endonuclease G, mitochondrial